MTASLKMFIIFGGSQVWWGGELPQVLSFSSVNLAKYNIHCANNGDDVGQHVVSAHVVHHGEVEEAWSLDLAPVRLAAPIGDEVDAKLALWCLDGCVSGSSRYRETLGEKLEMVDERLHGSLHLCPAGGHALGVVGPDIALGHLVQTLLNDPQALPHLQHSHQVAVVAIAVGTNGHIKVHQVICIVRLRFPKIPFDASASQHHTAASPVNSILSRDDANVNDPLLEQPVVCDQVLHLVKPLAELGNELVDVIQKANWDVLVNTSRSNIGCVHSGSTGTFIKFHHFLTFLKEPEEGGDATNIKDVSSNPHDVVEDPGELSKEHPDVLGPDGHIDVEQLLHGERVGLLVAHHRNVVQPIKVRESLQVGLVLDKLLGASVQQTNVGVSPRHCFSVQLEH